MLLKSLSPLQPPVETQNLAPPTKRHYQKLDCLFFVYLLLVMVETAAVQVMASLAGDDVAQEQ